MRGNLHEDFYLPIPHATRPAMYHFPAIGQINGLPPSPVQASVGEIPISICQMETTLITLPFPASPPAHIKLFESKTNADPSFVVRSFVWQVVWSTKGTSTCDWIGFVGTVLNEAEPQPATQHLIPLIWVLVKQPVVIVGTWPKGTFELSLKIAILLIKLDEE